MGSGGRASREVAPGPRSDHHFRDARTVGWRSHATLGRHRSRALVPRRGPDHDVRFVESPRRTPFRTDGEARLGPCSLPPRLFSEGKTRERIRDPTPPDDFCNCIRRTGHGPYELSIPRVREGGRDLRPGSDASRGRVLRRARDRDTRRAGIRPRRGAPPPVPPAEQVCPESIPTVLRTSPRDARGLSPRVVVRPPSPCGDRLRRTLAGASRGRETRAGFLDRVKDASPTTWRAVPPAPGVHA